MNILILLGRGIEGCGITALTNDIQSYLSKNNDVTVIANNSKKFTRDKLQQVDFSLHNFKNSYYSDNKKYDICIITSVPAKDNDYDIYDNFILTLENLSKDNTRLIYLQCDNKIASINRNFYADTKYINKFFSLLDRIIVHNIHADFVTKFLDTKVINSIMNRKFTIGQQVLISCDFDNIEKSVQGEKNNNTCWFIGRSAQWKGWREFRELHTNYLRKNNFVSVIEGIELSINAKQDLSDEDELKNNNKYVWRKDNLYEKSQIGFDVEYVANHINEFRDKPILIYGPYERVSALNRMHRAKFGMFFTYTGPQFGGQIEITFLEIVASGTIPVIRKELFDSAYFNDVYLKDLCSSPDELGIVIYDRDNPNNLINTLNKLNNDDELYKFYLSKAKSFAKSQFDINHIIKRLFDKCISDEDEYESRQCFLF